MEIAVGDLIPWNEAPVNMGGHFNTSSGLYTIPATGVYRLVTSWIHTKYAVASRVPSIPQSPWVTLNPKEQNSKKFELNVQNNSAWIKMEFWKHFE